MASPVNDGLSEAFGGDDSSFTETMTGIFSTVGDKFKGGRKESAPSLNDTLAGLESPAASGDGTSSGMNPKVIGIAAAAVVVVAGALFWFMGGSVDTAPEPASTARPAATITEDDADFASEEPSTVSIDQVLAAAEQALLESRLEDAQAAIRQVTDADPNNARLPFLTAQFAQLQRLASRT